ncbi:hypothetical protein DdX_06248 [Ditylenchus destructor]|uniref:Uncharacterized protein n=1 Tax=Ditylenchus destructor TaxID=166010 RepID=A0AAD4N8W0_9BILA|nr:hypothetical protein DdX_06248 [Ditylenchus destructor]
MEYRICGSDSAPRGGRSKFGDKKVGNTLPCRALWWTDFGHTGKEHRAGRRANMKIHSKWTCLLSRDTDSSSPGQFITRDNSSPATIHHLRQFITCDSSSPGQFITCDNSSPATIHHP